MQLQEDIYTSGGVQTNTLCTRGGDKSQRPDKKGIDIKPRQNRNK